MKLCKAAAKTQGAFDLKPLNENGKNENGQ